MCPVNAMPMIGCGTITFTDPDDYRVQIPGVGLNLVLIRSGDFKARVTWVTLRSLSLIRVEETLPRIAFVTLLPGPVFMSFVTRHHAPAFWNGRELQRGEIVLHSDGERIHQRTSEGLNWGLVSLAPKDLANYGRALAGVELMTPRSARFLRPPVDFGAELKRLHQGACRLAETKPEMITHKEVARALEQEMLHALINCVAGGVLEDHGHAGQRRAAIMARFEDVLASHCHERLPMIGLCAAVDVQERTLRMCCGESLGMSPGNYERLRRLNLARSMLRRADDTNATVAEIAKHSGFSELGRFAGAYRKVFGEVPSTTLRCRRQSWAIRRLPGHTR
jgi:AraC-like DNA-binding protein